MEAPDTFVAANVANPGPQIEVFIGFVGGAGFVFTVATTGILAETQPVTGSLAST